MFSLSVKECSIVLGDNKMTSKYKSFGSRLRRSASRADRAMLSLLQIKHATRLVKTDLSSL